MSAWTDTNGWDRTLVPEPETIDQLAGPRALVCGLLLAGAAWVVILAALYGGARLLEPLVRRVAGS